MASAPLGEYASDHSLTGPTHEQGARRVNLKPFGLAAALVALIFAGGYFYGSCGHADTSVLSESLARVETQRQDVERQRDSVDDVLAGERARSDSLTRVANRSTSIAVATRATSTAYRDTVHILNDSLVRIAGATTHDTAIVVVVPPEVVARMRADSATIDAERLRADDWMRVALEARQALRTSASAMAHRDSIITLADRAADLRETIAYRKGVAHGRRVGLVLGAGGATGAIWLGVKIVASTRSR